MLPGVKSDFFILSHSNSEPILKFAHLSSPLCLPRPTFVHVVMMSEVSEQILLGGSMCTWNSVKQNGQCRSSESWHIYRSLMWSNQAIWKTHWCFQTSMRHFMEIGLCNLPKPHRSGYFICGQTHPTKWVGSKLVRILRGILISPKSTGSCPAAFSVGSKSKCWERRTTSSFNGGEYASVRNICDLKRCMLQLV